MRKAHLMCEKKETYRFYINLIAKKMQTKKSLSASAKLQIQKGINRFYRKQQEIISPE